MKFRIYGIVFLLFIFLQSCNSSEQVDILIQNALVFDGSGGDSIRVDVGITGEKIAFIGDSEIENVEAVKVINAEGLCLAPGFIDPHTHTNGDLSHKDKKVRANLPYLMQGVTTVFTGNDGSSPLSIGKKLSEWNEKGIGTNAALFVGQGTIRGKVLGNQDIQPDRKQLSLMKKMVAKAMENGAFGLSTGLFYAPGSFADTEEVIELAKVAAAFGGIYDTHMRHQSTYVIEGVRETLEIGKEANIPVHISHIKVDGPVVWGKSDDVIQMVDSARNRGIDVTANVYPYLASRTSLKARLVPRWAEDGGDTAMLRRFDDPVTANKIRQEIREIIAERGGANRVVISSPENTTLHNKSIEEIASNWGINPEEAVIRILKKNTSISAHSFVMQEYDMLNFLKQPWVMIASDGRTGGHPRTYGTFPKVIREFVLDSSVISMTYAIHKATGLTAATLKMENRGLIKEGYYADIMLFYPKKINDNATYEKSGLLASGVEYVFVNGVLAIDKGEYTGALAGKALRKNKM